MKDLSALKYFLGIEVSRSCKPAPFPMEQNYQLACSTSPRMADAERYRHLVGRLIYLPFNRPNLAYSVHILSHFLQAPRQDHWNAVVHVVRYLKGCPGQGILLRSDCNLALSGSPVS
ncbi:hypothetical protein LIER_30025 [Lithospermum erythrorhizon]|uniref:Uncharacterized protein n=1 Tax=Lithospermum erythrorhizon TaxID=34254 RepID=A0AAV3RRF6_LITER